MQLFDAIINVFSFGLPFLSDWLGNGLLWAFMIIAFFVYNHPNPTNKNLIKSFFMVWLFLLSFLFIWDAIHLAIPSMLFIFPLQAVYQFATENTRFEKYTVFVVVIFFISFGVLFKLAEWF